MKHLSLNEEALIELVKIGIGTSKGTFDFTSLSPDDWEAVAKDSKAQAVALIAFDSTKNYKSLIPATVYREWLACSMRYIHLNNLILNAQKELHTLLTQAGIDYVILKGAASAYYYPDSSKRISGDIDFLTSAENFQNVKEILITAGYSMELENHDLHTVFKKPNLTLELHEKLAGMPDGEPGRLAKEFIGNMLYGKRLEDNPVLVRPADKIHALVILFHTIYHMFAGGMGLRHLCDWACFVNKTHKQNFWKDELLPLFEKMGLSKFVMTLTGACIDHLDIEKPSWFIVSNKELSDEIFEKILFYGNFGRKDPNRLNHYSFSNVNGERVGLLKKIASMFFSLHRTNCTMYPILKKRPYLYPFITVWRIIKYLYLSAIGKKTSLKQRINYTNERTAVFEKFEIYR